MQARQLIQLLQSQPVQKILRQLEVLVLGVLLLKISPKAFPELRIHQITHASAQRFIVGKLIVDSLRVILGEIQCVLETQGKSFQRVSRLVFIGRLC